MDRDSTRLKRPRFTLRMLLLAVTIGCVGLSIGRRMLVVRPVTEPQTDAIVAGLTMLEVRWRLGAPHDRSLTMGTETWRFAYADSELLPIDYFEVTFDSANGKVLMTGRQEHENLERLLRMKKR